MKRASLFALLVLAAALSLSADVIPPSPPITHTAIASGNWNQPGIWSPAQVPPANAVVSIPTGRTVTVTSEEASRLKWVQVDGILRMGTASNSKLIVETLLIRPNGQFLIAAEAAPLPSNVKAEIVFTNPGTLFPANDPDQIARGFIGQGIVKIYGTPKTARANVVQNSPKNTFAVTVQGTAVPADWRVGDDVVLTSSWFRRFGGFRDERRQIGSIGTPAANVLNVSTAFQFDHLRISTAMPLHIVNMTRNVIFRSEPVTNPLPPERRGHVILMNANLDIRNAAFIQLGRTNKAIVLDDAKVQDGGLVLTPADQIRNRRGRYSVHVHETPGVSPTSVPSKIWNCVVDNTPGWGFVNHSSHVDFRNNIAYDFTGSGFVTEDGDELGSFIGNTAIRGIGDGIYDKVRIVFQNGTRPQPISDFAFRGDGFWFQGPALTVTDNVANGCNGAGMIWHSTGQVDIRSRVSGKPYGSYTWFPRAWIPQLYANHAGYSAFLPRYWNDVFDHVITSDLPILKMDQFDGYGNFIGFRLRFNNYNNNDFYGEDPYNYDTQITRVINNDPKLAQRMYQDVTNIRLWNNEQAFSMRYTMRTNWSNVNAMNRLDYDAVTAMVGAEMFFQVQQTKFTNLTIDGWDVAGQIENTPPGLRTQISFVAPKNYLNYAVYDIWEETVMCAAPVNPTGAATGPTSARITWSASGTPLQYLVRYKVINTDPWRFATTTATFADLTGLVSNRTYTYQVMAGCTRAPSTWTAAKTFVTP